MFYIFSPGYNCAKFVEQNLKSVNNQNFKNFKHIVINDCSTDNTASIIKKFKMNHTIIINNTERKYKAYNSQYLNTLNIKDNDIIIELDLDDCFYNNLILENLNNIYMHFKNWITHSKFNFDDSTEVWGEPYSERVLKNKLFRTSSWKFRPLRTFKYFLFKNIKESDFKDNNGEWLKMAADLAYGYPMLEMATEHYYWINQIQYIYHHSNPLCDEKIDRKEQIRIKEILQKRSIYNSITGI